MNMPIFTGDAADLAPLQTLCRLLLDNGAWLHRELVIHAENGDLSLRSARPGTGRASYLRVPVQLMPALQDYLLLVDKDRQLKAAPLRDSIDPLQQQVMQLMLELYNQTGKLAQWEASYPGFAWHDQEALLRHLFSARPGSACQQAYASQQNFRQGDGLLPPGFLSQSFMYSRKFLLRGSYRPQLGSKPEDRHVLMPLIDLLNHHSAAEGYRIYERPQPVSMRVFSRPQETSGELFVCYNRFDALDTLLLYGFVDVSCPFFFSVPCSIQVAGQAFEVDTDSSTENRQRHPRLTALGTAAPHVRAVSESTLQVARLRIPDAENIDQLRLAAAAIGEISGLVKSHKDMEIFVRGFEAKVIEYNSQWWQTLRELTGHLDPQHPAAQLAARGCAHLESYAAAIARLH